MVDILLSHGRNYNECQDPNEGRSTTIRMDTSQAIVSSVQYGSPQMAVNIDI